MDYDNIVKDFNTRYDTVGKKLKDLIRKKAKVKITPENVIQVQSAEKKFLTEEEFFSEDFIGGYDRTDIEYVEIGDTVRYATTDDSGNTKYYWGGIINFKHSDYVRIKNVFSNYVWSVQLKNHVVFYVKQKLTNADVKKYTELRTKRLIDLDKASSEGLMEILLEREEFELIIRTAAELAQEYQNHTMIL